jgi:hypothetical protein
VYECTDGSLNRKRLFQDGEGILIDFKRVKPNGSFYWGVNFAGGTYGEDDWRNFGISGDQTYGTFMHLEKGDVWQGYGVNVWVKPNMWYRLLFAVDANGRILLLVWERDNPDAQIWTYRNTLGDDWSGREWSFFVDNENPVTMYFDNFYQLEFTEIK